MRDHVSAKKHFRALQMVALPEGSRDKLAIEDELKARRAMLLITEREMERLAASRKNTGSCRSLCNLSGKSKREDVYHDLVRLGSLMRATMPTSS